MELERNHSNFIRDLLVKVVLIVLFIFLLTKLFPMPNLTTFYDAVFNNNVQTMKDAAEDWFTTERMPKEIGEEETLSLQDMLDKKLILPFLDKDGKECDTEKSYVTVKKEEKEYTLKVYLSCNGKSDYIIEPIGCYNFCPDGNCDNPQVETNNNGEVNVKVPTGTNKNNTPNTKPVVTITDNGDKYKLQYLYTRTLESGTWKTGTWQDKKEKEDKYTKLVDTKTLYTGQKKVTKGTTRYKHVKYAYKDNWTYDTGWTDEVKTTGPNLKLYARRTLYSGQKRIENKVVKYKHIKKTYTDNWKIGEWTTNKRTTNDKVVLVDTKTESSGSWSAWKNDTTWRSSKPANTSTKQWGNAYDTKTESSGSWSAWKNDTTWRSSKPANTSAKQWGNAYDTKTDTSWQLLYSSYVSYSALTQYSGNRKYEELYRSYDSKGKEIWVYKVYEKKTTYQYKYQYRTYSSTTTKKYKYQYRTYKETKTTYYKYKENNPIEHIDEIWTDSITPPAGYTYANASNTSITIKYENLGKWVTGKSRLGEYTYNIATRYQYQYRYNSPKKYIEDTIWTESKTPPAGYTFTGETDTTTSTSYVDLGKWVDSKSELGEYNYNIESKKQYKYKYYNSNSKTESKWFDSNPGGDWVYANQTRKIKIN